MNRSESCKESLTGCRVARTPIIAKHKRQIVASLLVALLLGENTQAQSQTQAQVQTQSPAGNWQAVKNLAPGTPISVRTQHRYRCSVEDVTDDELFCEVRAPRRATTLAIRRSEIHEVRIFPHPNQPKDMWIGAGIGAGAGAVVAGTNSKTYPGANAFFGGLAGALPGAIVGGMVPIFQAILKRGKIIYKG